MKVKSLFSLAIKRSTDLFNDKKFFDAFKYSLADLKSETRKGIFEVISDLPPIKAKIPNLDKSPLLFGASAPIPPICIPIDAKLANPHKI